ncbi:hypothetical protein [Sinorhizobium sp. GL28]|uniref:hypothetical protein n=1 Tax=Sinorhizobium sp. GL28 TaxID=1358418 RepID=UPI00071CBF57|nr:hypothetical protein [Sinorhizobium sp. GL28]KSV89759.1 hypothetical protein N184_27080 [Sinorhizobium sp. GL28]
MKNAICRLTLCLALAFVCAPVARSADAPAAASETTPDAGAAEIQGSIPAFLKDNPDCLEFTDQCSHCAVVNGVAECSTAEIACIKRENQCTRRAGK